VTKKEIVKQISDEMGETQLKVKDIVQKTFDAIIKTLVEDSEHRIELRNFGVFEVKKRAARKARNPRTGDQVFVGSKFVVTFKPGKEMEEKVRELERAEDERVMRTPAFAGHTAEPTSFTNHAPAISHTPSTNHVPATEPAHSPYEGNGSSAPVTSNSYVPSAS
jgi:nucleoid DNA-binding protein